MTASYPSSVKTFTTHVNVTEIIDAGHPNTLQEEVVAIENTLGTTPSVATAATASGWANTATDYTTVNARLANIEKGVVADSHTQYIKNSIVTTAGDLLVGTGSGTLGRLGVGANGTYLTSNGTTAQWSTGIGVQGATGPQGPQGGVTNAPAYTTSNQTASAGQTVFTVTYRVGYLAVYVNGVRLSAADFTATNGTSVTLSTALSAGDNVDFIQITLGLGAQGVTGTQGASGTNGVQGANGPQGTTGPSGQFTAVTVSSNTSVSALNAYYVDTSSSVITLTLPGTPSVGNEVRVIDAAGNAATNNITVAPSGSTGYNYINGSNQNLVIDVSSSVVYLLFTGTTLGWTVI